MNFQLNCAQKMESENVLLSIMMNQSQSVRELLNFWIKCYSFYKKSLNFHKSLIFQEWDRSKIFMFDWSILSQNR